MFGEEKCVEIIQNTDKVAYWSFLLSLMYRLKSVATPSLKPPERSKKKKQGEKKKKENKEESHQKKFPLYLFCAMVNICACMCAFGSAAPRGCQALPQHTGTAAPHQPVQ